MFLSPPMQSRVPTVWVPGWWRVYTWRWQMFCVPPVQSRRPVAQERPAWRVARATPARCVIAWGS